MLKLQVQLTQQITYLLIECQKGRNINHSRICATQLQPLWSITCNWCFHKINYSTNCNCT